MKTIDAFDEQFATEESCKVFLAKMRWPNGVACPRCNNAKVYALKARPFNWVCKACGGRNGYRFSVLTGTIFQDTKKPLKIWFKVGYLMLVGKKGISALQVHRVIFGEDSGSDYRTSWYMCMRWRSAMQGDYIRPLTGEVEVDETYVGGKNRNRHWNKKVDGRGPSGKVAVIGAIARKGMVVAKVIEDTGKATLDSFVRSTVADDVSLIATDDAPWLPRLETRLFPMNPSTTAAHEYVRGLVHTASIDSFWSLLKRGIMGQFHHVSKQYLPLYVNEFSGVTISAKTPRLSVIS